MDAMALIAWIPKFSMTGETVFFADKTATNAAVLNVTTN
jgi:hypothetical protein